MKHRLSYRTELGGYVCKCGRYFHKDHPEHLERHIQEEKEKEQ